MFNNPEYSLHRTFELVCKHLINQDAKAHAGSGYPSCCYRTNCGKKCAAGACILDHQYLEVMEGVNVLDTGWAGFLVRAALEMNGHDIILCSVLQRVHDGYPVVQWKEELRKVAHVFGLACPACILETN